MSNKKERKTMKKLSILLGSALVMLTAGCTKDATKDVAPSDKVTVFEMNIEGEADARTVLDGRDVLWSEGDCVAINGQKATVGEEYVGTKSARFEVAGASDAPYRVIYPAEAYNDDGTITVSEIQEYAPNSFAQGAAVMVGYGETTAIRLQNLYGLVKITIKKEGDERIQSVTLHSNNLEAMTGTFTVDYATAAMTPLAGMDFVKVVSSAGIDYDDEGKAVIYIAVPAGTYAKGFTVKVATDNGTMSRSANSKTGATIERNTIYSMDPFQYAQGKADTVESINNAEQLQAFLNAVNAGDYAKYKASNGEVQLGADIDLKNVTITPATSFDGIFNGRGYKLKNWQSDGTALFAATTAEAVVKNIVIDSSCKMDVSNAAAGNKAFIVASNLGTVSGCTNYADMVFAPTNDLAAQYMIGAIVGVSTSATITNCHNKGNFTIALQSMTKSSYYFGGVVGDTAQKSSLTKCINEGNITITIDGTNGWKNVYLGGVSGACNQAGVLSDCINKGKVSFYLDKAYKGAYPNIGGITGYTANTVTNCKNYGDVSICTNTSKASDAPQITRPAIGGIAGYINGNVTGCENYGHILLQGTTDVKFSATTSYTSGGVGKMGRPVIGGVCGCVGFPEITYTNDKKETVTESSILTISDCHNYGIVELINPSGATWVPVGGVVGLPTGTIKNCTNEHSGVVKVTMGGAQTYLGGVYGCTANAKNTITDCANYGKVWFIDSKAVASFKATTRSYAGGISGGYDSGSGNKATGCVNEGEIISKSAQAMIVGGLFAAHNGSIAKCTNKGNVTVKNATAISGSQSEIGGIAGYVNATVTDCNSYGTITNNSAAGTDTGALIAAQGGAKAIVGGVIDCQINAEGSNVGFVLGSTRAAKVAVPLGSATAPITIKRTSAINGVQVTDADIAADGKLAGTLRTGASITITNVVLE